MYFENVVRRSINGECEIISNHDAFNVYVILYEFDFFVKTYVCVARDVEIGPYKFGQCHQFVPFFLIG